MSEPATVEEIFPQFDDESVPRPVGYHLLVVMPESTETFGDSEIIKPAEVRYREEILSMVGLVIDMGAQAYADKDRFPGDPWCKTGDYVMFRANSGTRFKIDGREYRLLNDDTVEAVVTNPRKITRAS